MDAIIKLLQVVEQIENDFGHKKDLDATLKIIDENGNLEIMIIEDTKDSESKKKAPEKIKGNIRFQPRSSSC